MSKYIEELNPWRSLIGYECEDPNTGKRRIIKTHDPGGYVEFTDGTSGDIHNFSAPHEMACKQWRVLCDPKTNTEIKRVENPLIEEAKKRYPPGTKFQPAHLKGRPTETCVIGLHENFQFNGDEIYISHGNQDKNGHNYSEIIYHEGNWAEIIEEPKEELIESPMDICKKKYPIGATVVSLFGKEATVIGEPFYWKTTDDVTTSDIFIRSYTKEEGEDDIYVYEAKTGRFAEVKLTKIPLPSSLEEQYAKELAEVEKLFPEGKTGVFNDWDSGEVAMTCRREGVLKFDTYEKHARIYSSDGSGILWSTKYGYSTPKTTYERPATPEESFMPKVNGKWIKTTPFVDPLGEEHVELFTAATPKPNAGQRLKAILFGTPNKSDESIELPQLVRLKSKQLNVAKITDYEGENLMLVKPKNK